MKKLLKFLCGRIFITGLLLLRTLQKSLSVFATFNQCGNAKSLFNGLFDLAALLTSINEK